MIFCRQRKFIAIFFIYHLLYCVCVFLQPYYNQTEEQQLFDIFFPTPKLKLRSLSIKVILNSYRIYNIYLDIKKRKKYIQYQKFGRYLLVYIKCPMLRVLIQPVYIQTSVPGLHKYSGVKVLALSFSSPKITFTINMMPFIVQGTIVKCDTTTSVVSQWHSSHLVSSP